MQTIHAVVALPKLYGEAIARSLSNVFDVHSVDEPAETDQREWVVACALRTLLNEDISVDDMVVLVTTVEDVDGIPAFCSRLLTEFPELSILGISRNTSRIRLFQLQIQVRDVPCSLSELSEAIIECTRDSLPW